MSLAPWLNTAWMLACQRERAAFRRAAGDVAATQARMLRRILAANRNSEYGRAHGFASLANAADYRRAVPVVGYDELRPHIERIAAGAPNVLTSEPVRLLEPTSGTLRGEKLIPYTDSLRRQFQRAVAAWIGDLFAARPAVRCGRAYWSISPAVAARRTEGGVAIGFDDDAAYLGRLSQALVRRLLVVPSQVARLVEIETFRYVTLAFLLAADDLSLISIWNPSFLPALFRDWSAWRDRLCDDLNQRRLRPPAGLDPQTERRLLRTFCPPAERGRKLLADLPLATLLQQLWPRLSLVSCWTDAAAALSLGEVRTLLPEVEIQSKGLMATEGCVSFPLVGREGAALAIRSHFFEFQPCGGDDDRASHDEARDPCLLAHELQAGCRYRVLLTTGGGLYRYALHDAVLVRGFFRQCPLLSFVGKTDATCDLVGEKLSEPHVRACLDRTLRQFQVEARFALVAPVADSSPHYCLYLQGASPIDARLAVELAAAFERGLRGNPHYDYSLRLGQLAPLEVALLSPRGPSAWSLYERRRLAQGQKLGDIKPAALDPWPGWADVFADLLAR